MSPKFDSFFLRRRLRSDCCIIDILDNIAEPMNTYSQYGQSEWLLNFSNSIGLAEGVVFEAGAHSPKSISNSMCFIEAGWRAILIEPSEEFCRQWNEMNLGNIEIHCTGIKYDQNGLQSLLYDIKAPREIDVLFLDIDGGEYHLLRGLSAFRPKLICVEYDNSYPLSINFVPSQIRHGIQASSLAMFNLMTSKGYTYIRSFSQDHIFIANEVLHGIKELIQFPIGRDSFVVSAPANLYKFHKVLLNQQKDQGGKGIDYYSSKLSNLIDHGYLQEAKSYYYLLSQVFHSYKFVVQQLRDDYYLQQFDASLQKFDRLHAHYLFHL